MHKEALFEAAKAAGIEDIEMLVHQANTTKMQVFEEVVDSFKISESKKLQFRGIYQGSLGTCGLEEDLDKHIPFVISTIIQNAQAITSQDEVEIYGEKETYPDLIHSPNHCLQISVEEKIALLQKIEHKLKNKDKRMEQVMGISYQDIESGAEIANSKGIHATREATYSILSASILASDEGDKKSAYEVVALKDITTFDTDAFVDHLVDKAIAKLHATQMKSGLYPVLIEREAMADLLRHLVSLFNGEDAHKGISLLQGKVQEQIFDAKLTMVDDPLRIDGFESAIMDDEGVATKTKTLVDKGVLQGYLHNLKSAKLMHTKSSGNGFYGGISATNFYIENGSTTMDSMLQSIQEGVLITELNGLHAGFNSITTQFSLQASGFYIKDGKIDHPVNLITIAGNLLSLLKDVTFVGDDLKFDLSGIGTPSLLFPQIAVSGE